MGWRIEGTLGWLHGFVARRATAYVIDPTRGHEPAEELLGLDYSGTLIHDGWSPYDRFVKATHQQCLQHILRRCQELLDTATRGAVRFPRRVAALLRRALALRDRHEASAISDRGRLPAAACDDCSRGPSFRPRATRQMNGWPSICGNTSTSSSRS
jgi:transposase